jgi:hypothetical protein
VGGNVCSAFGKQASFLSLGYRSPERPKTKRPGGVGILFSGGSTTIDITALDNASSWPRRVETALLGRDRDVAMFDAGFPRWTSLDNLISLAIRDLDVAPDIAFLFQGSLNDPCERIPR